MAILIRDMREQSNREWQEYVNSPEYRARREEVFNALDNRDK